MPKQKESTKKSAGASAQLKFAFVRYHKLAVGLIVVVLVAASYFFILEPKYQEFGADSKNNIDNLRAELVKRQKFLENLQILTSNYQKFSPQEIARLQHLLPKESDIPGLFVQLQALTLGNNIFLAGVSINESPEAAQTKIEGVKKLSININLVGSAGGGYDEIKRFLDALENNLRLFDVTSVFFSPDSNNFSVNLLTYYY